MPAPAYVPAPSPALSKPGADRPAASADLMDPWDSWDDPWDEEPCVFSAETTGTEPPLTSEPPLPDAEPFTSEPPLADVGPLSNETDDTTDPSGLDAPDPSGLDSTDPSGLDAFPAQYRPEA
ncbi:hypothetical protein [Streptomyces sp. bgisy022]|uniref:hypothetical protein n=1 Tax=Streptomyces sp. bgisy022 TaxID=3413769 RepID=UPI003D719424